jgi:hypothetical protein
MQRPQKYRCCNGLQYIFKLQFQILRRPLLLFLIRLFGGMVAGASRTIVVTSAGDHDGVSVAPDTLNTII